MTKIVAFFVCIAIFPFTVFADTTGTQRYNSAKQSMEFFNGTSWVVVGAPICNAANISSIRYNISSATTEYCDGTNWQAVAVAPAPPAPTPPAPTPPNPTPPPTQTFAVSATDCNGYHCTYTQANADKFCTSKGFTSAIASTQGGSGCNSCYWVAWTGTGWSPPANHCNSCHALTGATCQ